MESGLEKEQPVNGQKGEGICSPGPAVCEIAEDAERRSRNQRESAETLGEKKPRMTRMTADFSKRGG
jgi:hypothetical protein